MKKNRPSQTSLSLKFTMLFLLLVFSVDFSAAVPVKIMPLGDSITAGQGCWRAYLWNKLQTNGYTNVDFVGSVSSGGCSVVFDSDCEGHGGISATGMANNNQLPPWLDAVKPDIILMHLGTNDMWGGFIPVVDKLTAFTKLVGQMRANNPNIKIIVAQIIPMSTSACATCPADVVALNNEIPGWAAGLTTSQSPIIVCDQWSGFNAETDTKDGTHPNDAGEQKMANKWYPILTALLSGTTTPTPVRTLTPTPIATSGIKGDANSDGKVDIVDALLVAQYAGGVNPSNFKQNVVDVNCSGVIDIVDALMIARYVSGLIASFPC